MPHVILWILIAIAVIYLLGYIATPRGGPVVGYRAVYGPGGGYVWPVLVVIVIVILVLWMLRAV